MVQNLSKNPSCIIALCFNTFLISPFYVLYKFRLEFRSKTLYDMNIIIFITLSKNVISRNFGIIGFLRQGDELDPSVFDKEHNACALFIRCIC